MTDNQLKELEQKVLAKVLILLGYRARTKKEIEQRLEKYLNRDKDLSDKEKQQISRSIFSYLHNNRLFDDKEFTRLFVESQTRGNKTPGRRAITQKLLKKGIPKKDAEEYVESVVSVEDELTFAIAALTKKYHISKGQDVPALDTVTRDKMGRFLLSRGFSYQIARQAVDYLSKRL